MHFRLRLEGVQNRAAAGHRACVPVFQQAAGGQHDRIFGIGCLVGRQDLGRGHAAAAAFRREAVAEDHLAAGAVLVGAGIGHRAFIIQPLPADAGQRGHNHPHFGKDVARVAVGPVQAHAVGKFLNDPPVLLRLAGHRHGGAAHLHAAVGVGDGAVLFGKGGGWKDHVGKGRRLGHEDVLHHQNVEIGQRRARMFLVRVRHRRVLAHDVHGLDVAVIGGIGDLDDRQPALRIKGCAPEILVFRACLGIGDRLVVGEEHRDQAGVGRALDVVLPTERVQAGAGAADIAGQQRQRDQAAGIVGAVRVLRDAHAPEDHRAAGGGVAARDPAQRIRVDAADRGHGFRRGVGGAGLQVLEPLGLLRHIVGVIQLFGDDHIDHRIQHRHIASRRKAK